MTTAGTEDGTVTTLPIRIAVRVDFNDGSHHEYEVLGPDAVATAELPEGPLQGFWPQGVVTTDVATRMRYDNARNKALADVNGRLDEVRDWAERNVVPQAPDDSHAQALETGFLRAVSDVLAILDKP